MKTFHVEAKTLSNGIRVTTTVRANSAEEAEMAAGRKILEFGFDSNDIKIVSID